MNFIQYAALSLLVALGIPVGVIIAKNSEEELSLGSKYIKTLMMVIAYLTMLFSAQKVFSNALLAVFLPTMLILGIFYIPRLYRSYVVLIFLGIGFSFALKDIKATMIPSYVVPSLIFLSFICIGTMTYYTARDKFIKPVLLKITIFFITALLLYLV